MRSLSQTLERRCVSREKAIGEARKRLEKTRRLLQAHLEREKVLRTRLECFEQENADKPLKWIRKFRHEKGHN